MASQSAKPVSQQASDGLPPLRRLWQAPVFALGVIALVVVILLRPASHVVAREGIKRRLARAQAALDEGNLTEATTLAQAIMDQAENNPRAAGEAAFILGSAELAESDYAAAREHLQQALRLQVSTAHQPRLVYRLAKCALALDCDRMQIANDLESAAANSPDDRVEGYDLLVKLWLSDPDPDWEAALKANEKLLAQPGLEKPNPVRLRHGEILLTLHRTEEARQVLGRISAGTPEYPQALSLQAESWFREEEWVAAADLWAKVVELAKTVPAARRGDAGYAQALYNLGLCYKERDRLDDSLRIWDQLVREAPASAETLPALLLAAEAQQKLGHDAEALAAFNQAIQSVPRPLRNRYVDLAELRQRVEAAWAQWLEAEKYDAARDLARAYAPLAAPGESARRFAQASEAAGLANLRKADLAIGLEMEKLMRLGRQYSGAAGEAFARAAAERASAPDHAELLWSAAENARRAQEYTKAIPVLEKLRALPAKPRRRMEILVSLAEALQGQCDATDDSVAKTPLLDQATQALCESLTLNGPPPLVIRAKYLLALTQSDRRQWGEAEKTLKDVVTMPLLQPEPMERRQGLFALGWVVYQQERYLEAARYFRDLVEQYPHDRRAPQARYWLAESYRQAVPKEEEHAVQADLSANRERYRQLKKQHLEAALAQFQHLAKSLAEAQAQRPLTTEELALLREGRFGAADCLFRLEDRAAEGIAAYEELVRVYAGKVEGLQAYARLEMCHAQRNTLDKAEAALAGARELLGKLTDEELKPTHRRDWQSWVDEQTKHLHGLQR